MKKIYKIILLLLFLVSSSSASINYNHLSLDEFVFSVSQANNINIFIDQDLTSTKISFYVPNIKSPKMLLKAFRIAVNNKGLNLKFKDGFYYLSQKKAYINHTYMFKLKFNCVEDFKKYLDMNAYKYSYIGNSNAFIVLCNNLQNKKISTFLRSIDIGAKQVMIKFIIMSFDNGLVKELGFKFGTVYKSLDNSVKSVMNAIVLPFTSSVGNTQILPASSFYTALHFMDTNHDIKINQFPYILAQNNKAFRFDSVQNIPYLVSTTKTDSSTVQNNTSYQYKDVGLKIKGSAKIYDTFVTLDLDLTIEDIINTSDNLLTPSTNKRYLNSITNLKFNQVLILSGIKQNKLDKTFIRIPFLCNIPYLGKIFQYKYATNSKSNISIAIQVIKSGFVSTSAILSPSEVRASDKER